MFILSTIRRELFDSFGPERHSYHFRRRDKRPKVDLVTALLMRELGKADEMEYNRMLLKYLKLLN